MGPRRALASAVVGGSGSGSGSHGGVDCRIHFALNCGAKSCPPIRNFHADAIEEELRIVSQAFCEDNDNVEINVPKRSLSLNKILGWYRGDFCPTEALLPAAILPHLRGEKRDQLQRLLDDGKPIAISYKTYDWSTDASEDFRNFESTALRADKQRLAGWFSRRGIRNKKETRRSYMTGASPSRSSSKTKRKNSPRRSTTFDDQILMGSTPSSIKISDPLVFMKELRRPFRRKKPSSQQRRRSMDNTSTTGTDVSSSQTEMDASLAQLELN